MFDDGSVVISVSSPADAADEIRRLRERMQRMSDGVPRRALDSHPALAGVLQLRAGGTYEVDSTLLALALMAGPSAAGGWSAVLGMPDLGVEAAAELGVVLERTILVPDPGTLWLEVTAALVDVVQVVVLRPPARVSEHAASTLSARLRTRGSVLVACGRWPRSEARLSVEQPRWSGVGAGTGHLRSRRLVVTVQRGAAPAKRTPLWFPAPDGVVRRGEPALAPAPEVAAVREAG
ncbi:hypothetical protein GHK92_06115 [Nocardioides sp. dk4132]|nr:hypothetical protein [Nocardioides sp. dk4132]QGA08365.1 hypothetical protein GFH29_13860 [Nocardioides sp. dk884]